MGTETRRWELGMEIILKVVGSVFLVAIALASMVAIYVGGENVGLTPGKWTRRGLAMLL